MSNQTIWTGKVSNIWLESANWTKGIPSFNLHAYIPKMDKKASYPVVSDNLKVNFTLKNDGEIRIKAILLVQKNGIIQNYGIINNTEVGMLVNEGNVMNFGEWINEGTFDNKRIFTNKNRLFNNGVLDNENTFVNLGSVVNTGVIDNHLVINNVGSLENFNILENHGAAEVHDKDFFPQDFLQNEGKKPAIANAN